MIDKNIRISKEEYRYIFLVQNRDNWKVCPFEYDKEKDLVLSFDFAVVNMVKSEGAEAQYIDHIVDSEIMESYNYKTYEFFAAWHYNVAKQDIFSYRGIEVGSAFRIEIWNDITFYVRIFVNLHELLKRIKYDKIYTGLDDPIVKNILKFLNITTIKWGDNGCQGTAEYYFPIFRYMDEALHPNEIRYRIRVFVLRILDKMLSLVNKLNNKTKIGKYIYIEWYHPTNNIISELKKANNIKMIRSDFNGIRDIFSCIHLPIFVSADKNHNNIAKEMLEKFGKEKCATLFVGDIDISDELYKVIMKRVSPLIANSLKIIDVIIDFFAKRNLSLMITIASVGIINRLMINYCKKVNISVYMIINGWLGNSFLDEAKDGTWINSYSESIKKNYFKGMDNIVCFGDPRMDEYSGGRRVRKTGYLRAAIGVGASGFANVDLNCFLAIEFEFLNDIMKAYKILKEKGKEIDLVIKVRQNSYIQQYKSFLNEYYYDIPVALTCYGPIKQIYEKVDFFISIYSQSLFEASALGIPVLYYKNDTHYYHAPFDGKSELVTAFTPEDLVRKIEAFYNGDRIYDSFKDKKTLEKYIGPLDGKNLKRNMDFIYSLYSN